MATKLNYMQRLVFIVIFTLVTAVGHSQETPSFFDVARFGTVDQIKNILAKNPTIITTLNQDGFSALLLSIYRNNNEVAKYLLENGASINENSPMGSPLMAAIVKGNNEMATLLLDKKADVNTADANGTTALIYAVQFSNTALITKLLQRSANKNHKDKQGKTAFEYAVFSGNESIINQLK